MTRRGRRKGRSRQRSRPPARPDRRRRHRRILLVGFGAAAAVLVLALVWRAEPTRVSEETTRLDPETAERVALGERLYAQHCASCHGPELEGQPNWRKRLPDGRYPAPPHDATGHTWHHDDAYLFETTKRGGQATAPRGFASGMPAFAGTLSDEEVWAVLTFIKSRWPPEIRARQGRANR